MKKIDTFIDEPPKVGRPAKDKGEVRHRGRPKKDEVVDKPFVPHVRPDIKDKNKLAYAEKTVKAAEKAYKKYSKPHVNPLNLEVAKITSEAKDAWKYVYSLRGYTGDEWKVRERTLETPTEVLLLFEAFCNDIRDRSFAKTFTRPDGDMGVLPIVPSQTNFARWLGVTRFVINTPMRGATEDELSQYKTILADTLSEGAMMGVYQTSMAIFSLKNLCDWADKYEDRPKTGTDTTQSVDEAQQLMESLGYGRLLNG